MKAQAGVEFIAFVTLILIIASVAVSVWWPLRNAGYERKIESGAVTTLRTIVFQINTDQTVGDGYQGRFFLDQTLLGVDYNISQEPHFVSIQWSKRTAILPTIPENVTGNFKIGDWNTVKNVNGVINVN